MRAGLDVHAVLKEHVGRLQAVLALVDGVGDMVEAAAGAGRVARKGDVVGLVVAGKPAVAERAGNGGNQLLGTAHRDLTM